MPDLNSFYIFTKVVELRSFTEAAVALKMQKSTVSRAVSALENSLKRQLIYRTTRQIDPTPQGKELFARCHDSFATLVRGINQGLVSSQPMRGRVRIAAVQDIGITLLSPLITEFAEIHPDLEIEMLFEDKVVDLVSSSIDISVRAGKIKQQSFRGIRAGSVKFILVASPKYLEKSDREISMENLRSFDFLAYQPMLQKGYFLFERGGQKVKFTPKPRFESGSTLTLHCMTLAGAGISALPDFLCEEAIKNDTLIHILKGWSTPPAPITVVTPAKKDPLSTVSVFSKFLSRRLSERLG